MATAVTTAGPRLAAFHAPALVRPPSAPRVVVRPRYRILITASREWVDPYAMWKWLDIKLRDAFADGFWSAGDLVIIHGDAPGGDQIGKLWAQVRGHAHEPYPAKWQAECLPACRKGHRKYNPARGGDYCPAAGHYRNQEMVNTGADVCGAFILDGSHGAEDCRRRAQLAGIPTEVFRANRV